MRRVPTQLEVYEPETSYKSTPDDVISYEDGLLRVKNGKADFVKHGKAIRMRASRNPEPSRHRNVEHPEQRGFSCRPGTGMHDLGARNLFKEQHELRKAQQVEVL